MLLPTDPVSITILAVVAIGTIIVLATFLRPSEDPKPQMFNLDEIKPGEPMNISVPDLSDTLVMKVTEKCRGTITITIRGGEIEITKEE